jgi:electron transfer flavoprotein alpha subunit
VNVLAVAETRRGALRPASLDAIAAGAGVANATSGRLSVLVIDEAPERFADELSVQGVDELLFVTAPAEHFEPRSHRALVAAAAADLDAGLVIAPMSVNSLGFVPALAAEQAWGLATDVTAVSAEGGELTATRPEYGGKIDVELGFPDKPVVVLAVREGVFERPANPGSPAVRPLELDAERSAAEHLEYVTPPQDSSIDITAAEVLVAVGRGIEDEDDLEPFEELAEAMGGTLAVSRPLVDAGWAPSARQVGQSGKTVRPKVYLAMGISGAVQHVAGIRDAELVIAINTDPEAPIFRVADCGAVADMFEVADELALHFSD